MLAVTLDVDVSHRLQRGDWRGLAAALPANPSTPGDHRCAPRDDTAAVLPAAAARPAGTGAQVLVSEIDEAGYAPIRPGARTPPAPGFRFVGSVDAHGMIGYRFRAATPRVVSESQLVAHPLMVYEQGETPEVLVSPDVRVVR